MPYTNFIGSFLAGITHNNTMRIDSCFGRISQRYGG